jgi:phage shock protein C
MMKRLYRSKKNRVIAGVCGGIAEYLEVDPVLVRLIAVLLLFVGGGSFIAYIIGMIIIPNAPLGSIPDNQSVPPPPPNPAKANQTGGLIIGVILIVLGISFLLKHIPFFQDYYWWFWNMGWNFLWPSILILIGLLIIFRAGCNRKNGDGQ